MPLVGHTVAADARIDTACRLHVRMCDECWLVQTDDALPSGQRPLPDAPPAGSRTWAGRYAKALRTRLRLRGDSLVMEIDPHEGGLLGHFRDDGVPVLGIGLSTGGTGVPTEIALFNTETAMDIAVRHGRADLVIANDVLQHAPDLFEFAAGLASILRPNGVLVLQAPHLLSLLQKAQFDAFGHDRCTYLSLRVLEHVLRSVGLRVFDAGILPDDGGSLRVHACHAVSPYVAWAGLKAVRLAEGQEERNRPDLYAGFADRADAARDEARSFVRARRVAGRRVAAYGAVARGSMLLNYCGMTEQEITCVGDADSARHGRLMPGSRIPVVSLENLAGDSPDDVFILSWPDAADAATRLMPLRRMGAQLWTLLPRVARA